MTTITNAYTNALLADATYALKLNGLENKTGGDLTKLLTDRMTPTLAQYIGDNFTVVTHIETDDTLTSGFDATVWKENATGKIYLSMQGITGLQDLLTDVTLAFTGNAGQQVIDMANWWLKITTPVGQMARQIDHTVDAVRLNGGYRINKIATTFIAYCAKPVCTTGQFDTQTRAMNDTNWRAAA